MKLFYFTKYGRLGASSRLRSFQFFPALEREGFDVEFQVLFGDRYVQNLYSKKSNAIEIVRSYFRRFFVLFNLKKYDIVVIEKELFPYLPPVFEFFLTLFNVNYIVDYDDPIFHNYDLHKSIIVRKFLGHKIDKVMRMSSHVFCGNSYLEERALQAGAKSTSFLPTVIDLGRYNQERNLLSKENGKEFVVGWIGSPSTIRYLFELLPVFDKLALAYPQLRLHIIGAKSIFERNGYISYIPWNFDTEIREICNFNIGVMPLHDTPFEKGKCSYKLIQYMGCSKAVVASPIGSNNQVVTSGWNGILAYNRDDWYKAIAFLIENPHLCVIYGKKGFERVKEVYNLDMNVSKMLFQFKKIAK